jgi:hypothetical protein
MAYFILELETGLIDGWYSEDYEGANALDIMEDMAETWDELRPSFTHIVAQTNTSKVCTQGANLARSLLLASKHMTGELR